LVEIIAEEEEMIDINCGNSDKDNKNNGKNKNNFFLLLKNKICFIF